MHNLINRYTIITLEVFGGFKIKPMWQIKTMSTFGNKSIGSEFVVVYEAYNSRLIMRL